MIRRGLTDQVRVQLRALAQQRSAEGEGTVGPKELQATLASLEGQRHAIVNDELEMAVGEYVGRGAVEKAGDGAVNRRVTGRRGMRWWRTNADGILPLRILPLNRDWDAYWQKRRNRASKAA